MRRWHKVTPYKGYLVQLSAYLYLELNIYRESLPC